MSAPGGVWYRLDHWSHRFHVERLPLIGRRVQNFLCDRFDRSIGVFDDEPIGAVLRAFRNGQRGVTAPPSRKVGE